MRVTHNMMFDKLSEGIAKNAERLMRTQEKIASGKNINRPSDDPRGMGAIMGYRHVIGETETYLKNIGFATDQLANSESVMQKVQEYVIRMNGLAVDTADATDAGVARTGTAFEVDEIIKGLVGLANTKIGDRYIFSGYLTDTRPFDSAGLYSGDSNEIAVNVGPGQELKYGLAGDRVFKGVGVPGGVDIFQIAIDFKNALQADDTAGIQTAVGQLEQALNQVSYVTADIGGRLNRLKSQEENTVSFQNETAILLSGLEDADITKLSIDLVTQQTALEALQLSTAKVFNLNIFNYLQ
jgi:flagellar hook-associated protein 3 FlgL